MGSRKGGRITWSPKVSPIHRKSRIKKKAPERIESKFSIKTQKQTQHIRGEPTLHARTNTRNSLLTIRDERGKRSLQLLVDIPNTKIRRIYDGVHTWDVHETGQTRMNIHIALGTIFWLNEENRRRKSNARGFDLSRFEKTWKLRVNSKLARTLPSTRVIRSKISQKPHSILKKNKATFKSIPETFKPTKKSTRKKSPQKKSRKNLTRRELTRKKSTRNGSTRKKSTRNESTRKKSTRKKSTRKNSPQKMSTRKKSTRKI